MTERRQILRESLAAIERLEARLQVAERAAHEPLAIVGAGCRYPGGIEDPEGLWRVVRDGVDAVSEVPPDRWDASAYYSPDPKAPGKMVTRRAGFLSQVDRFDPQFFGISPREAATMDPQQRLLLETAYEALESAAIATDRLSGTATGVFVGITTSDYGQLLRAGGPERSDVYSATGSALNAAAGRLAFTLGLQGPCVAVDTACSSSLVAVHLACQSLRAGESDLALAGGVNVILSPDAMVLFSKWGMIAPDGACKTFDAAADGFVRAEGCAVIALKRLSDALAAGDPVLAVIRGSAVNSDGRSSGLTVPNGPAQQAVVRKALASAELSPGDIDYVEAHGTGTSLGDPIEVEALGAVMREGRPPERPLLVGSIKTNIGHAEAASGLAGLLKVVMALRHGAIPPHLHFSRPNPAIPWGELAIAVPTALAPWPRGERPRRAGVSSFGFSGTNAHVVLEEAPAPPAAGAEVAEGPSVVPLSARDEPALRELARRTAGLLASGAGISLAEVAHTAGTGRAHLGRRLAILADSAADLERDLRSFAEGRTPPSAAEGALRPGERPKVAFLFTGQGAQYAGMGRGLYDREPVFRGALDRAAAALAPRLERPLLEVLFPAGGAATPLAETGYTQPALFAIEWALSELWRSWGVTPSVVLGHSVGEYVAACVAGVMSLEDGLALIAERGRLMQALPAGGGMAAVFAEEARVLPRLAAYAGRLAVAAVNGPEEIVISGDAGALAEVVAGCARDGIESRPLEVSHAFHSPRLDPMLDALERRAGAVVHAPPRIPLVSNLTGAPFPAGAGPDARYWRRHAREPVRFTACVEALRAAGVTALVEVGPHPTLLGLAARAAPGAPWASVASLRRGRDDRREMLSAAAALYARGADVAWDALRGGRAARRVALPTYPFQRERHWVEAAPARARAAAGADHPLLGERRELASAPGTYVWEGELGLESHPWLGDHRVQGTAIVPATAYIEMALAAGAEVLGAPGEGRALKVEQIENLKPLAVREGERRVVQAALVVEPGGGGRFAVHSRPAPAAGAKAAAPWTAHVTARIAPAEAAREGGRPDLEAIRARCGTALSGADFYAALARKGNQWGPCFQGLREVWIGDGEAFARVQAPDAVAGEAARFRFHPALSDACGHTLVATLPMDSGAGAGRGAFVGGGVGEIRFHGSPAPGTLWTHAKLREKPDGKARVAVGDVRVYDDAGSLVSETLGARLWYLDEAGGAELFGAPDDWFYEVRWQPSALEGPRLRAPEAGTWLVLADRGGVADRIAALREPSGARTVLVARGDAWSLQGDRATIRPSEPGDYRRLLAAAGAPAAVVHLWSAGAAAADAISAGPESLLHLLHALLAAEGRARPRVWLATRDAQAVAGDDRCEDPWGAALWGMGRALAAEHAELWGGLVDLCAATPAGAAAEALVREVEAGTADDKVALRPGGRYVPRLARRPPGRTRGEWVVRADGTYLVTGGLGGIGLAVARWLVERGARHLLLLGRTAPPPPSSRAGIDPGSPAGRRLAALAALEASGAKVEAAAVDVAVEGPLERCLEARRARGEPPVRGVLHAAGVLTFRALAAQDAPSLRAGLAAKVDGAWRLHRILGSDPLDCFVLFSSSSALLGSPLLGGYAAGNAFLDALAHHRRARGLPALSVSWGTWGEVGMAVEAGKGAGGAMLSGLGTISTSRGLAALRELLEAERVHAAVMPIDWGELARVYPGFAADPFFAGVAGEVRERRPAEGGLTLTALRAGAPSQRAGLLQAYLRQEAARALGMDAGGLDPAVPLSSVGFDSLMAVQLKNRIETDLGVVVPMIQFLQGPSVDELAPAVLRVVEAEPRNAEGPGASAAERWEEGSL